MRRVASCCIDDELIDDETLFDARIVNIYVCISPTSTYPQGTSTFPLTFDQLDSWSWTHSR